MDPLWYATRSTPAHKRAGAYAADTAGLGLVFQLMRDFPKAHPYLVGGTVRDAVLGVLPHRAHVLVRDVAPPILHKYLHTHGAVTKHSDGHWHITPRGTADTLSITVPHARSIERGGNASRIPAPQRSIHDDLASRDFSVNAMAYSLRDGILIDPHGGLHDLVREKTVRSIHPPHLQLHQEPALIARALRLASQFGMDVHRDLWTAIPHHHPSLHRTAYNEQGESEYVIPRVRLGHDMLLALAHHPSYFLALGKESDVFRSLAPELLQHGVIVHDDGDTGWQKTEELLAALHHYESTRTYGTATKSATLLLAGILSPLEDGALHALRALVTRLHLHHVSDHRLTFDHLDTAWLLTKITHLMRTPASTLAPAERERIVRGARGGELLALLDASLSAQHHVGVGRDNLIALREDRARWLQEPAPETLVRGRDLLALGFAPGPHLRTLLQKVRSAQLEGHLSSRGAALDFARYLAAQA